MKNIRRTFFLLIPLLNLMGCGVKGLLYFSPTDKGAVLPLKSVPSRVELSTPDSKDCDDDGGSIQMN